MADKSIAKLIMGKTVHLKLIGDGPHKDKSEFTVTVADEVGIAGKVKDGPTIVYPWSAIKSIGIKDDCPGA